MKKQIFLSGCLAVSVIIAGLLSGCGGHGSSVPAAPTVVTISGFVSAPTGVTLGHVAGRSTAAVGLDNRAGVSVDVFLVNDSGQQTGDVLTTTTTDSNGMYALSLSKGVNPGSNLVVNAGTAADPMRSFATKSITDINPLTELVVKHIAASGKSISGFSVAQINSIQNQVNTDGADNELTEDETVGAAVTDLDTGTLKTNLDAGIAAAGTTAVPTAGATVNPTNVALSNGSARTTLTCSTTATITTLDGRCSATGDWIRITSGKTTTCTYTATGTYTPSCRVNGTTVYTAAAPVIVTSAQPAGGKQYIVVAWNDLGMHCLNPTYDTAVILPPYNTVHAQVIKRGNPPKIVTTGLTMNYQIINNTYSYGKRSYGQFWDNAQVLFGGAPAHNYGLNLEDPGISNGMSGAMLAKNGNFQANGIPVTPVDDSNVWNPYQVIELTLKSGATTVATTRATIPTSDEINCAKCHGATNTFANILAKHDKREHTTLASHKPVLCASCHGSPALGQSSPGSSGRYLSQAIHGFHSTKNATCYDCHPGTSTRCSRSIAHTATDGKCTTCHGSMANVASTIASGSRIPWANEPKCTSCHSASIPQVDTGSTLYRNAKGHGNISCTGCHGSPHAMVPSQKASDNYQAIQYMGKAKPIGSCAACHSTSKGEGSQDFFEEHGAGGRLSSCSVCHTGFTSTSISKWPHSFSWKSRP
jgi:hypothetical protein